ncbi:MAG: CDP-alcohol phosphatidyltransferase family protein [Acidobacteria bacterium]|nr:CDP-alcohol phosphatidyltransferase family protein [Acidobacteriota bacterium]
MGSSHDSERGKIRTRVEKSLRPMTLPNFITFLRMAMIPFFVLAVNEHEFQLAALIFVLAGVTDAMDGAIARSFHMESLFGTYLDPIADKLLLSTAYIALTIPQGQAVVIPLWLTIMALFRDALIVIVALLLYVAAGMRRFRPTIWGKLTTFMHVSTVTLVLVANIRSVPDWLLLTFFYVSFGFVIISGFNYIYRASKMLEAVEDRE